MKTFERHTGIKAAFDSADGRTELKDVKSTGLYLRVNGDRAVFVYRYRLGQKRAYTLPNIEIFKTSKPKDIGAALTKARAVHAELRARVKVGDDPAIERDLKAREIEAMPTVAKFAETYIELYAKLHKKTWKEDQRYLNTDIVPALGRLALDKVKRAHIVAILDKKQQAGYNVTRNRLISLFSSLFKFGIERGHLEHNLASGIKRTREVSRSRALSDEEIVFFWQQTGEDSRFFASTRLALRLILITAQRPGEVAQMMESQLEGDLWTMEDTKNGRVHVVPLYELALQHIEEARPHSRKGVVMPNTRSVMMGKDALPQAMQRMNWPGEAATPHDLRRTATTEISKLGFNRLIQDKITNHKDSTIGGIYDRYDYLKEKRQALDAWNRRLTAIVTGQAESNVIQLRSA